MLRRVMRHGRRRWLMRGNGYSERRFLPASLADERDNLNKRLEAGMRTNTVKRELLRGGAVDWGGGGAWFGAVGGDAVAGGVRVGGRA